MTSQQLEQSVTRLQIVVGYTTEQVNALPPPLVKIRELEQDNARLQKENDELRRLLHPDSRTDATHQTVTTHQDPRTCDRDYNLKRRGKAHWQDGVYIVCSIVRLLALDFILMRTL
jgi:regulator of replication initiation timing